MRISHISLRGLGLIKPAALSIVSPKMLIWWATYIYEGICGGRKGERLQLLMSVKPKPEARSASQLAVLLLPAMQRMCSFSEGVGNFIMFPVIDEMMTFSAVSTFVYSLPLR